MPTYAAFKDPGYGARPAGMGNAFVAVADDVNAILYNPAGATQAGSSQVSLAHAKPFAGLDDVDLNTNFLSVLVPVSDVGTFGLGWADFIGPISRQDALAFSAATSMNRWLPSIAPSLSVGFNYRYFYQQFDLDSRTRSDSVFAGGRSRGASSFDLGLWLKPDPRSLPGLALGVMGKSLNEPDIGLAAQDKVPRELVGGAAYSFQHLTLAFDVDQRDHVADWRAGAEMWFRNQTVGIRAGANSTAVSTGFSYLFRTKSRWGLFLDYAFSFPYYLEETGGSHRASLGILF